MTKNFVFFQNSWLGLFFMKEISISIKYFLRNFIKTLYPNFFLQNPKVKKNILSIIIYLKSLILG